jgi:hypothetical protein
MTLLERDILAVLLSLNTVFMILVLPNLVPIDYSHDPRGLFVTTLLWGMPLATVGVWINHRAAALERKRKRPSPPSRRE